MAEKQSTRRTSQQFDSSLQQTIQPSNSPPTCIGDNRCEQNRPHGTTINNDRNSSISTDSNGYRNGNSGENIDHSGSYRPAHCLKSIEEQFGNMLSLQDDERQQRTLTSHLPYFDTTWQPQVHYQQQEQPKQHQEFQFK